VDARRILVQAAAGNRARKMQSPLPQVRFENVKKRYGAGREVLAGTAFELREGSFHFLLGSSGAGKSTLLRLMHLAEQPTGGRIELFGRETSGLSGGERAAFRRRIGIVFQDFRLLPHLTALENVALPLRIAGADRQTVQGHVGELLNWVGLSDRVHKYPAELSGGEQQRIAIARAVIAGPSLLLADEPTGSVDDRIGARLIFLFEQLHKMGTTVLIATHNLGLVQRYSHPVLRLEAGRIVTAESSPMAATEPAAAGQRRNEA
jgi:cell division transport system ATP-binding protein